MPPIMTGAPPEAGARGNAQPAPPAVQVPFVRAAHRHMEPAFDQSFVPGSSTVILGPHDVPAHGFIRDVLLLVEGSGGTLGVGVLAADFPWNAISEVSLTDTNGYPLVFPIGGYQAFLVNLVGGYRGFNDPTLDPDYVGTINFRFAIRLPVEITPWDTFGSLQNQSAAAPFRVRATGNTSAAMFSTAPTTPPTVRVRGYLEAYSPVALNDLLGQAQETAPPGHGAQQFWSVNTPTVSAGQAAHRLTRVGNLIRNMVFIHRDSGGARSALVEPDSVSLTWDSRELIVDQPSVLVRSAFRSASGVSLPTGVLVFPFTDDQDGSVGYENRHLWLPTVQSTRLEYSGNFGAAGTLEILTNDVAVTDAGR